ncbi:hypothetical protein FGIG_12651 [Fasciola gigantica]|uniref:Reverse transcriptase domain-containing protein n=1 Tax=Fasciola gigantica TaxID=46835 RepID=A0A504YQ90_FASGI|nr:hypothetical protein FGIG_12651 [Fasciola gigantica]
MRFLWYPPGKLDDPPKIYQLNVHPFGATSSPFCAAFALRQVANDQHSVNQKTLSTVERNFYVEDCLVSVESVQEAITLAEQLRNVLIRREFRLHKWVCNTEAVIKPIAPSEQASTLISLSPSDPMIQKTLGLYWRIKDDCFTSKLDILNRRDLSDISLLSEKQMRHIMKKAGWTGARGYGENLHSTNTTERLVQVMRKFRDGRGRRPVS